MEQNDVFLMGEVDPSKKEKLKSLTKKLWGIELDGGSQAGPSTLEFLPMELKGESPLFIMVAKSFARMSNGEIPGYKKVSASKNNCRTGVILQDRESPMHFSTDENKPDFFINIDTGELFFS